MAQTTVNFEIDENVKLRMESACKDMGISLNTAFNIFAIKVGNERKILLKYVQTHFTAKAI